MGELTDFPEDENGDVLRRMVAHGDDLAIARDVDFTAVFPDEQSASRFADHFRLLGYKVAVASTEIVKQLPWDVLVVNPMVPSHSDITDFELQLERVAGPLGGRNDGWGSLSQGPIRTA